MTDLLQTALPSDAASSLCRQVTAQEIKSIIFAMGNDKASGPDSYTTKFFKVAWNVVSGDVVSVVL